MSTESSETVAGDERSIPILTDRECPTLFQTQPAESGAACLGMVLGFHGRGCALAELRFACGIAREGSKAANLLLAAKSFGLVAKQQKSDLLGLGALPLPAILGWSDGHFLVLEGADSDGLHVNDPAIGRRIVELAEFDQRFTGVALTFERTPAFVVDEENFGLISTIRSLLVNSKDAVTLIVLVSIFLVIPGVIIPAFSQIFIDEVLGNHLEDWLRPLLFGMLITTLLRAGLTWLRSHYLMRLQVKLTIVVITRMFWRILRLRMSHFAESHPSEVMVCVKDGREFSELIAGPLAGIALNLICAVFFAGVMLSGHLGLASVGIGLTLLNVVFLYFSARFRQADNNRLGIDEDGVYINAVQGIEMIETLKATASESEYFQRWGRAQTRYLRSTQKIEMQSGLVRAVPVLLSGITSAAVLGYGGYLAMDGAITIGTLVAFQSLLQSFSEPITDLMQQSDEIFTAGESLLSVKEIEWATLDRRFGPERKTPVPSQPVPSQTEAAEASNSSRLKLAGRLEFRGIGFGYSPVVAPLIHDFNLTVEPGHWVALVGKSGSGKSTLAKIATGLYEPSAGEVLLDGVPLPKLPREQIVDSVVNVSQDVFLFDGSVRDNITLWNPVIPEDDVVEAAKDACIHDVIAARHGAYDSRVLESGQNFSGGQMQRLGIARALVCYPTLLVLDEATSDLDPVTETRVMENLRRRGCSVLVIAQRLSTIRDCDEIVFLQDGKIMQRGTHEALRDAPGPYAEMLRAE